METQLKKDILHVQLCSNIRLLESQSGQILQSWMSLVKASGQVFIVHKSLVGERVYPMGKKIPPLILLEQFGRPNQANRSFLSKKPEYIYSGQFSETSPEV